MSTGCEACRSRAYSGSWPPPARIAVNPNGPSFLHECEECGGYWDFDIRIARPITEDAARQGYPEVFPRRPFRAERYSVLERLYPLYYKLKEREHASVGLFERAIDLFRGAEMEVFLDAARDAAQSISSDHAVAGTLADSVRALIRSIDQVGKVLGDL